MRTASMPLRGLLEVTIDSFDSLNQRQALHETDVGAAIAGFTGGGQLHEAPVHLAAWADALDEEGTHLGDLDLGTPRHGRGCRLEDGHDHRARTDAVGRPHDRLLARAPMGAGIEIDEIARTLLG